MSPEEKSVFKIDERLIDWRKAMYGLGYGLRRFHLQEDAFHPDEQKQLLRKNNVPWFHDISVALTHSQSIKSRSTANYGRSIDAKNFERYLRFLTTGKTSLSQIELKPAFASSEKNRKNMKFLPQESSRIVFNKEKATE